jgi:hypothetical protein
MFLMKYRQPDTDLSRCGTLPAAASVTAPIPESPVGTLFLDLDGEGEAADAAGSGDFQDPDHEVVSDRKSVV